jgi:putative flavoprotein involved in K+ transport
MHLSPYRPDKNHWDTIVIGGGQAGLATGYFLKQLKQEFIILDESGKTGDSWRNRWDSLQAFTPGWTNGLPGMPFPGPKMHFHPKTK